MGLLGAATDDVDVFALPSSPQFRERVTPAISIDAGGKREEGN